jgi:hypothetical protein
MQGPAIFIARQARSAESRNMIAGFPAALILLAQAASAANYGPSEPQEPKPAAKPPTTACPGPVPTSEREIVICAERPNGYRLDPDVMEAHRAARNHTRPKPPDKMKDNSCTSVGPMLCGPPAGINLVSAAVTAVTMATKAVKGENVGRMFVTDPQPSEYQLYLEAKARREAEEAEKAAEAKGRVDTAREPLTPR